MFCEQCGNKISDNAKFCSQCGCKVISADVKFSNYDDNKNLDEMTEKNKPEPSGKIVDTSTFEKIVKFNNDPIKLEINGYSF